MAFVFYFILKEANIHINLICFDGNFDHPHINVVTSVPSGQSKKSHFLHKNIVLCSKSLARVSVLDLSSLFSQNCSKLLQNCFLIFVPFIN